MATRRFSAIAAVLLALVLMSPAIADPRPPTVITASATLTGTAGFAAGGNVIDDGGLPVTQRGLCWGTSPSPTTADSQAASGAGTGAFTCSAGSLLAATHYYFRAYATNGAGTGYGQQMTIITGSQAAPSYAWTPRQASADWSCLASSLDGARLIAGAYGGRLYTSSDFGVTWTERAPDGAGDRRWECAAASFDAATLVAGIYGGGLYASSDSGATWTEVQPAGPGRQNWQRAAVSSDGTRLIAAAYLGRLWASSDAGATWTELAPTGMASDACWNCLAASADGTKVLVGVDGGRLYRGLWAWDPATSAFTWTWTQRRPAGDADRKWYTAASSADGSKLMAGCYPGRLYTSFDSGATWAERRPDGPTDANWQSAAMSSDGTRMAAGAIGGGLFTSVDSGLSWARHQPAGGANANWQCAAMSADGTRVICGVLGGRLYTGAAPLVVLPTVTTTAATGITGTAASAGGNVMADGGAAVTARGVCWATTANPTTADAHTIDGSGVGSFTSSLTGLTPGTLYHYRAYATNSAGTAYGEDLTVTATALAVDAGGDQEVFEGAPVSLHAAACGTVNVYSWTQKAGKPVTLGGGLSADASFTAPTVRTLAEATLVFRVTVVGPGGSVYDDASIRVWPLGDINRDTCVDVVDLLDLVASFGNCQGEAGYSAACDLNGDACVDVIDLLDMVGNFGRCLN